MVDVNDDLAGAKKPFKVVACMPVFGRRPLLKHTIERLYRKNGVYKVICSGDQAEDKKVCEDAGAVWVPHANKPLGAKWNAAFVAAKEFKPDACLFVGSSDWLSDNWCIELAPYMQQYDMVGTLGCHFADISDTNRVVYWPGYEGKRAWESIGIGRLLSHRVLEKLNWKPFSDVIDSGLDGSMSEKIEKVGGIASHTLDSDKIKSVSISTGQWINKHKFNDHWNNVMKSIKLSEPDKFLFDYFPEAFKIFN